MFTPAADSAGMPGAAITGFDLTGLSIVDDNDTDAGAVVLAPTNLNQQMADNSYRAILQYSVFADTPLTVKIDQSEQKTSNPDEMGTVGTPYHSNASGYRR